VCEGQGGTLVVVDPRAARERLLLQALTESFAEGTLAAPSPTLFSQRIELPFDDAKLIAAVQPQLLALGIEVEPFGGDSVAVKRVPQALEAVNLRELLLELADAVPLTAPPDFAPALKVMASHGTQAPLRTVTHDEAHRVLSQLDGLDFSVNPEHGRVVIRQTPLLELVALAD
jgi:DNA mismatch repair protein MutL